MKVGLFEYLRLGLGPVLHFMSGLGSARFIQFVGPLLDPLLQFLAHAIRRGLSLVDSLNVALLLSTFLLLI